MPRSRRSAKKAGAGFERLMADYFKAVIGDEDIDRQVKTGAKMCCGGHELMFGG